MVWEHHVEYVSLVGGTDRLQEWLRTAGLEGWELVSVIPAEDFEEERLMSPISFDQRVTGSSSVTSVLAFLKRAAGSGTGDALVQDAPEL